MLPPGASKLDNPRFARHCHTERSENVRRPLTAAGSGPESNGEAEKGEVVAGVAFVAGAESAVAGQPRDRPLDHPPSAAQPFAGLNAFTGDAHADSLAA